MALASETDDGRIRVGIAIYAGSANGLNADDARIITNMLTNALAGTPNIRLYERQQLDAVMRELQRGQHTLMDENTIVELGMVTSVVLVQRSVLFSQHSPEGASAYLKAARSF